MINGGGNRKCTSWIDSFVEYTSNLESPERYRRWSAITMVAAILEQKVWVDISGALYPNIYTFLIGPPGIGKSRAITSASSIVREASPEAHFGATSMTRAALSDYMEEAKRFIANIPFAPIEYNSLIIVADEMSAFMHEYDSGLVAALVEFYDVNPYAEGRRVSKIRIKIDRPQLNILTGSTPSNLIHTLKDYVWEQGLMSRVFLIYADDRPLIDIFNEPKKEKPKDLIHDIKIINTLQGQFTHTKKYEEAMQNWKILKMDPEPKHPKLRHYCTRRWAHVLKLSMIASVDRSNDLCLEVEDFNTAVNWLFEAEAQMPMVFQTGAITQDSRVMDEIAYFIKTQKGAVGEHLVVNFAKDRLPIYAVRDVIDVMENSKMIKSIGFDAKTQMRKFIVP